MVKLPEGTINIALLGVDKRPTRSFANTDVIILASINPDTPSVVMLSIPRDTPAYIPGFGVSKINTAFAKGGPDLFKQTILYNFGIQIDYYAMVNFEAVVHAVDALGGVDIVATCPIQHTFPRDPYYMGGQYVTQDYVDTFTGEVWKRGTRVPTLTINIPKAGVYTFNGLQALAYVRARYGIPGGDVDRGRREQRLVRALFAKAKQIVLSVKIPALFEQLRQHIQTDMALDTILYFASIAGRFNNAVIRSRFLDWGGANGVVVGEGLLALPSPADRHRYLQQVLSIALNQRPNDGIPIEVWNGTNDPGFGAAAADRLAELGFRIVDVRAADRLYDHTVIYDHNTSSKGSAVPLLLRTFNLKQSNVVQEPNRDGPRYRIVVGPDFNTCYYARSAAAAGNQAIGPDDPAAANLPADPIVIPEAPPTPTVTVSPAPLPTEVIVLAGNVVNVRSGPGREYRILGRLSGGSTAPVLGQSLDGAWWHIRYRGKLGWIFADYAAPVGAPVEASETNTVPAGGKAPSAPHIIVPTGNVVNIRAGPGVRYALLGQLTGGQQAIIIGKNADQSWWQIRYEDSAAWISARFVRPQGDLSAVPIQKP
ncbi:MAG: LCP family protein [Anaerolineae bacterium]|nr:LCP family protein [Thermoflexales bacterium]MDW8408672.1 LCP family protein [Anaerolineae bacterium]